MPLRGACRGHPGTEQATKEENTVNKQQRRALLALPLTIEYKLNPKAKWSNGRAMDVSDYVAQWKALNGTNTKFAAASTTGYEQVSDVSQGKDQFDVIVTFKTPFAEWPTLFNPLYPKEVNDNPTSFSAMYNNAIPITGGPFKFGSFDKSAQ